MENSQNLQNLQKSLNSDGQSVKPLHFVGLKSLYPSLFWKIWMNKTNNYPTDGSPKCAENSTNKCLNFFRYTKENLKFHENPLQKKHIHILVIMCRKNSDSIHAIVSPSLWLQCALLCLPGSLELGSRWTAPQCESPQVINLAKPKCFYIFSYCGARQRNLGCSTRGRAASARSTSCSL